jgi:hypothetical protein
MNQRETLGEAVICHICLEDGKQGVSMASPESMTISQHRIIPVQPINLAASLR